MLFFNVKYVMVNELSATVYQMQPYILVPNTC